MSIKYLSFTNAKSNKSLAYGYLDFIMYLAPHDTSGHNMCSSASPECIEVCLFSSGKSLKPCFRLDGTSDAFVARHFLKEFPTIQWYDYTKVFNRLEKSKAHKNYHLTFSFSGRNERECLKALDSGFNVAVSFKNELPVSLWGYPVLNGDKHDLRFLDPMGHIVGLAPKGNEAKKTDNAFFVN